MAARVRSRAIAIAARATIRQPVAAVVIIAASLQAIAARATARRRARRACPRLQRAAVAVIIARTNDATPITSTQTGAPAQAGAPFLLMERAALSSDGESG